MQSQIESAVVSTNVSSIGSKESSLRPMSPQETKENGINGLTNGTNNSNGTSCNSTKNNDVDCTENRSLSPSTVQSQQTNKTAQQQQSQHQSQQQQQSQNGSDQINETKDNLTKDDKLENNLNGKQENNSNLHHVNNTASVVNTFQPDPSKSAFMSPNNGGSPGNGPGTGDGSSSKNEEFVMQQQLYADQQSHEMKSFGIQDYTGFRNGMPQQAQQPQTPAGHNSWDQTQADSMNINYGPPPILAAGPPTGMPPGKQENFLENKVGDEKKSFPKDGIL